MNHPKSNLVTSLLCALACAAASPAFAGDSGDAKSTNAPQKPAAPTGLLPIPDYGADFWSNPYLTGDWGSERTKLADKGIQFNLEWTQYVQGVADGGAKDATRYGSNLQYDINLDLMQMGVLPGALIKFRAESRYGDASNSDAGTIFPVNTRMMFPLTTKANQSIGITITNLNYTQFLSPHLAVVLGKMDTLDGDPNEFASGRGTNQFMNASLVFNPTLALRLPYSTLGAGIVWMPITPANDTGITVTNLFFNTQDSSTTSGFDDFDKGTSWNGEADFRYKLGDLPGGMNIGGLYSFNQHFAQLKSRLVFQPGQGLSLPSQNSSWAAYWSGWQYVITKEPGSKPLPHITGIPTREGIGFFSRVGFADKDTNPVDWAASGGIGGRGMIPSRENDSFGVGYFYNHVQRLKLSGIAGLQQEAQGVEAYYNIAVTPACRVTFDVQVVDQVQSRVQTATLLGARATINF